jgi:hypothetical protein
VVRSAAVRIELALAGAEDGPGEGHPTEIHDPLFRLKSRQPRRWAESDFARLVPVRDSKLRIIEFDFDVSDFLGTQTMADFPADVSPVPSYMIAFRRLHGQRREPLVVDLITREIPRLCRGGSKSLTIPAIAPQAPTDETLNASREAHERIRSMTYEAPEPTIDDAEYHEGVIRRGTVNLRCARGKTGLTGVTAAFRRLTYRGQRPRCRFERLIP